MKKVKTYQELIKFAKNTFFNYVPEEYHPPENNCPPYDEIVWKFPSEDWGGAGDFVLAEEVFVEDEGKTYCVWAGCFWDPDQEHDRFIGVWINERVLLTEDGWPDPAEAWHYWIGWFYKYNEDDEPEYVGFVED